MTTVGSRESAVGLEVLNIVGSDVRPTLFGLDAATPAVPCRCPLNIISGGSQ